ncbi:shikimate kinase [Oceanobacillus sp. FSL W8-0428]|uniref:Shikimate kinase n=1 Tax=Oceanobacillus sojae TaxID=582851 RepID=A0A511ZIK2_9BACI|nr:shikimate kinase [Oceanobacillus sojae]GEN87276.1 shikimate kinase [Oceanobacillus sojae]
MNKIPLKEQSIVLIGFMGVGKTTIGQAVAQKLYRDFIDIDEVIERRFQMPPKDIFAKYGEAVFRQHEKEIISEMCHKKLKVISLGGGAFLQKEIQDICLATTTIFFLDLTWDKWKDRIGLLIDSRPVLQGKNMDEIKQLFDDRQPIYEQHHSRVLTDDQEVEEVADYIVDSLKLAWELYA